MCENAGNITSPQLTFWPEDSPASRTASPAGAKAKKTSATCGLSLSESSESLIRFGYSLRTSLASELQSLTTFSLTWKRQATPRGRLWWVLGLSGRRTGEIASGSWPTMYGFGNRDKNGKSGGDCELGMAVKYPEKMIGGKVRLCGKKGETDWPSPRSEGFDAGGGRDHASLPQAAKASAWPTPSARDWKDSGEEPSAQARNTPCLPAAVLIAGPLDPASRSTNGSRPESLRLNPAWVEVLMGYPEGWTALDD